MCRIGRALRSTASAQATKTSPSSCASGGTSVQPCRRCCQSEDELMHFPMSHTPMPVVHTAAAASSADASNGVAGPIVHVLMRRQRALCLARVTKEAFIALGEERRGLLLTTSPRGSGTLNSRSAADPFLLSVPIMSLHISCAARWTQHSIPFHRRLVQASLPRRPISTA